MKIAIISDTHDHIPNIKKAVEVMKGRDVGLVIHAGDFCSPFAVLPFKGLNLVGVFGNNDGDVYRIMDKFSDIGATHAGEFLDLKEDALRFAVYHGTQSGITEALVKCGTYDVVISGHTHEKVLRKEGKTTFINPGSAHGFDKEATFVIFDTATREAEFITIE